MISLFRMRCRACAWPWVQTMIASTDCPFCGADGHAEAML